MGLHSRLRIGSAAAALTMALAAIALCGPGVRAQPAPGTPDFAPRAAPATDATVLTLLGTQGGPGVTVRRAGMASLVTVRGKQYLVDAGIGVSRRLAEAGVPPSSVSKVFLTHLHNDHTAGLFGLLSLYSTLGVANSTGIEVIGPPRTAEMVKGMVALSAIDWDIRAAQGGQPAAQMAAMYKARDVQPGLVYQDEIVKVTAFENTHFNLKGTPAAGNKSYAYKFQTPHKTIVFSGDTGEQADLAKFAEGADILVCEMVSLSAGVPLSNSGIPANGPASGDKAADQARLFHMLHEHLSPTQVGQLARDAKVKQLVLSHLVGGTDADVAEIRKWYSGPVVMGEDLQVYK